MKCTIAVTLLLVALAQAKPKFVYKDDAKRKDAHREAMSHMHVNRFAEYDQMHDDDFMDAFENDLDLAHIKYGRQTEEKDAGPPIVPDNMIVVGIDLPIADEPESTTTINNDVSASGTCDDGWQLFAGQCYLMRPTTKGGQSFEQADNFCLINHDAHLLLATGSSGEDAFLIKLSNGLKGGNVWLGLSEPAKEGEWTWQDGSRLKKSQARWAKGSPAVNPMAQCSIATPQGWNDVNCEENYQTICQKNTKEQDSKFPFKYCPGGWEYSTANDNELVGVCFLLGNDEKSFDEAQADCASKNANLISVTTQEEYDMTARITRWPYVWLGLNQKSGTWAWTDGKEVNVKGFEGEHKNFLATKIKAAKPLGERKYKAPKIKTTFATDPWCLKKENLAYCDKRNSRWIVGNRWDDWQMWCKRNVAKCEKNKKEVIKTTGQKCAVINTATKVWELRDCNARSAINYACKTDAYLPLPPADPTRKIPNHFTQFSDKIGDCTTTDRKLIVAHTVCLKNWFELHGAGATVAKLATQCPNFCDPITKKKGDGSCIWDIACVRCDQLVSLCLQPFATATCERYIGKNIKKSDHNRCPQFDLCYPATGVMQQIQDKCLSVYGQWEKEYKAGLSETEITYPCDSICARMDEDCGWKILCKKCTLLMSLSHTGRRAMFTKQFKFIMGKSNTARCQQYAGNIMPPWWVTGNWI